MQAHKAETKRSSLIDLRRSSASCKPPKSPVLGAGQEIPVAEAKRAHSLCTKDKLNVRDDVFSYIGTVEQILSRGSD